MNYLFVYLILFIFDTFVNVFNIIGLRVDIMEIIIDMPQEWSFHSEFRSVLFRVSPSFRNGN